MPATRDPDRDRQRAELRALLVSCFDALRAAPGAPLESDPEERLRRFAEDYRRWLVAEARPLMGRLLEGIDTLDGERPN